MLVEKKDYLIFSFIIIGLISIYLVFSKKLDNQVSERQNLLKEIDDIQNKMSQSQNQIIKQQNYQNDQMTIQMNQMVKQQNDMLRKNNYIYYPEDAIIYQNIFNALREKIIDKNGNPNGWDDTSWNEEKPWNERPILRIGFKNIFPNGLRVNVPSGKKVIWIRCLNDRWISLQLYKMDGTDLGNFCSGFRSSHHYSPDGGEQDSMWNLHTWFPIPVPNDNSSYILTSGNKKNDSGIDAWISGIAFSTNPWNHAFNSAVGYHWNVNEGENVTWAGENWNNDQIAVLTNGKISTLVVPVVPSGRDKLFYIAEHNSNWDGAMHRGVTVDDVPIERLSTAWNHSLSRTINSKIYYRVLAARIPENLIGNKNFITVKVNLSGNMNNGMYFREAGTIDLM